MNYINCEFSEPVYWHRQTETLKPLTPNLPAGENWNFKNITCETEESDNPGPKNLVLIKTPQGDFWLNKSWTFGELFISFFLVVFLFIIISKSIWGFFYPQIVKIKKKNDI